LANKVSAPGLESWGPGDVSHRVAVRCEIRQHHTGLHKPKSTHQSTHTSTQSVICLTASRRRPFASTATAAHAPQSGWPKKQAPGIQHTKLHHKNCMSAGLTQTKVLPKGRRQGMQKPKTAYYPKLVRMANPSCPASHATAATQEDRLS